MIVLLDNGHGAETEGKRSPVLPDQRQLFEYKFAREVADMVQQELNRIGITAILVTPESEDIKLRERCKRINAYCKRYGKHNCISVSIHCNATGTDGKWHDASGFSVFVSPNASSRSQKLAQTFTSQAEKMGLMGNRWVPPCRYWVKNLAMCRDTACPAVLTENLFMDNMEDAKTLLSREGKERIAKMHVEAIVEYVKSTAR